MIPTMKPNSIAVDGGFLSNIQLQHVNSNNVQFIHNIKRGINVNMLTQATVRFTDMNDVNTDVLKDGGVPLFSYLTDSTSVGDVTLTKDSSILSPANPADTFLRDLYASALTPIRVENLVHNQTYVISKVAKTDFKEIGANSNNVGHRFKANIVSPIYGGGTAIEVLRLKIGSNIYEVDTNLTQVDSSSLVLTEVSSTDEINSCFHVRGSEFRIQPLNFIVNGNSRLSVPTVDDSIEAIVGGSTRPLTMQKSGEGVLLYVPGGLHVGVLDTKPSYLYDDQKVVPSNNEAALTICYGNGGIDASNDPKKNVGIRIVTVTQGQTITKAVVFTDNNENDVGHFTNINGVVEFRPASDYRLKRNIQNLDKNLMKSKILRLRPLSYTDKNSIKTFSGFLAHEIAQEFPHMVTGDRDRVSNEGKPLYQTVNFQNLYAPIVSTIQKLSSEIDILRKRVCELENQKR
jgi:hypothetical protein